MKKYFLTALKFLVFLGLGIFLIWLSVKNIPDSQKPEIIKSIREADYKWIVLCMLVGILAHVCRALRWRMLFEPLGYFPKISNTIYAVFICYLGNLAINRLGEVLRCGILKRYEKIPITLSLGTVIAERVIDTLILLVLFIFSAWVQYEKLHSYISEKIISPLKLKLISVGDNKFMLLLMAGILLAAILLIFLFRKKIFNNPIAQKVRGLLLGFVEGMRTVAKVKNPLLFIFYSVFIWVMYLMSVFLCVFAFKETQSLTLVDCIVIMSFGSIGVIATPGGIGAYQYIVLQIMVLWGYSESIGFAFGTVAWGAQTAVILVIGLLSFIPLAFNKEDEVKVPA